MYLNHRKEFESPTGIERYFEWGMLDLVRIGLPPPFRGLFNILEDVQHPYFIGPEID